MQKLEGMPLKLEFRSKPIDRETGTMISSGTSPGIAEGLCRVFEY